MKHHLVLVAVLCVVFAIAAGYATRLVPGTLDPGPNYVPNYVESPVP